MGTAKLLSEEECLALSEDHGWSIDYSEGYAWGQSFRPQGKTLQVHVLVGNDELALGFRAGCLGWQSETASQVRVAGISEAEQIRRRILAN